MAQRKRRAATRKRSSKPKGKPKGKPNGKKRSPAKKRSFQERSDAAKRGWEKRKRRQKLIDAMQEHGWLNVEAALPTGDDLDDYLQYIADELGITIEEARAMYYESLSPPKTGAVRLM